MVGTSCIDLIYFGYRHFDNGAISKIDDVQIEHGGQVDGTILRFSYSLSFVVGRLLHA